MGTLHLRTHRQVPITKGCECRYSKVTTVNHCPVWFQNEGIHEYRDDQVQADPDQAGFNGKIGSFLNPVGNGLTHRSCCSTASILSIQEQCSILEMLANKLPSSTFRHSGLLFLILLQRSILTFSSTHRPPKSRFKIESLAI